MSGLDIAVGRRFVQKRRSYGERRVIEITRVDYSYVSAEGYRQERAAGGWVDVAGTRRRTRLLNHTLRNQYEPLEES